MNPNVTPDLSALVEQTARLVEDAGLIENWADNEAQLIRAAYARGMTVMEFEYDRDCDAAETEAYGQSGWYPVQYPDPSHYGLHHDQ